MSQGRSLPIGESDDVAVRLKQDNRAEDSGLTYGAWQEQLVNAITTQQD